MNVVEAGQVWDWMGARLEVKRVARNGAWADLHVTQAHGAFWPKRQPLPLPEGCVLVSDGPVAVS